MRKVVPLTVFIIVLSLLLGEKSLWAQDSGTGSTKRPKIALVLGGGGARGAAHCGVLKVLEANKIPVDFIVGTSMGSIVGGLYAAGYSPEEIENIFNEIDWLDLLSDRPSEDLLSFRNKRDFLRLSNFEMGIKDGKIVFPRGIISGQKLDFMLNKLTIHTLDLENFDELRIPFRAVATDAATGKAVIFDKGNLAEAIRASMSVPGAFPPVRSGGKLLMDGFLVMNVPVEIAKEWGADIIIAVDVGPGLIKEQQLKTLVDMTNQMINILSQRNVDESLSLLTDKDILIKPELGGIGSADFVKTPEAVRRGEKTALTQVEQLKRYSVSENEFQTFLAHQRQKDLTPPMIKAVEVVKPQRVNERLIKGRIKTKPGELLNFDQLAKDLTNIYAIGDFETVGFDIKDKDGKLLINAKEKPWGPRYLRFGFNLQSETGGTSSFGALLDYRHTQINELGGEWKVVGQIGEEPAVKTEFYQPLDSQGFFFVEPNLGYQEKFINIYEKDDRVAEYKQTEAGGGFDIGANLKNYLEARVGIRRSVLNAKPSVGGNDLPEYHDTDKAGVLAQIDFDQLDDHRFPTRGARVMSQLYSSQEALGADDSYEKLKFAAGGAKTVGRHTLILELQGGVSHDDLPYYERFTVGGLFNLSGLASGQLRGQNFGTGGLIYYFKLLDTKGFANKIFLGGSVEAGNTWEDRSDFGHDPIFNGSGFVGIDTVLGPLYFGFGKAEGYDGRGFIYLGKTF